MFRTRTPLSPSRRTNTARLACVRPPASVHPEPGSNSPLYVCSSLYSNSIIKLTLWFFLIWLLYVMSMNCVLFASSGILFCHCSRFASAKVKGFFQTTKTFLKFFLVNSKVILICSKPSPALPSLSIWDCKSRKCFPNHQNFFEVFFQPN